MGRLPEFLLLKEPQRRMLRYAGVLAAAGLLLMVLMNGLQAPAVPAPASAAVESPQPGAAMLDDDAVARMERAMAANLERILGQVEGAGRVQVQVALAGAVEREYASDQTVNRTTTEERDRSGGSRVVSQVEEADKIVSVQAGRGQEALVRRLRRPEVKGVLVVAEGAGDPAVRAALARAVQAAIDVPLYRISVLTAAPGRGGER